MLIDHLLYIWHCALLRLEHERDRQGPWGEKHPSSDNPGKLTITALRSTGEALEGVGEKDLIWPWAWRERPGEVTMTKFTADG